MRDMKHYYYIMKLILAFRLRFREKYKWSSVLQLGICFISESDAAACRSGGGQLCGGVVTGLVGIECFAQGYFRAVTRFQHYLPADRRIQAVLFLWCTFPSCLNRFQALNRWQKQKCIWYLYTAPPGWGKWAKGQDNEFECKTEKHGQILCVRVRQPT